MAELEAFVGMREAVMRDERGDVRDFGLFRTQEFLAGRDIEEEIADGDRGAFGERGFVAAQQLAAGDFDCGAGLFAAGLGFE